jgi:hypothetical protein
MLLSLVVQALLHPVRKAFHVCDQALQGFYAAFSKVALMQALCTVKLCLCSFQSCIKGFTLLTGMSRSA